MIIVCRSSHIFDVLADDGNHSGRVIENVHVLLFHFLNGEGVIVVHDVRRANLRGTAGQ